MVSPCCVTSFVDYNYGVWYCCRACGRWYEQAFNVERSAPFGEVSSLMAFNVYPARAHASYLPARRESQELNLL